MREVFGVRASLCVCNSDHKLHQNGDSSITHQISQVYSLSNEHHSL